MSRRWYLEPEPGGFRGTGFWVEYKGSNDDWDFLRDTGFLPTHEGDEPPKKDPAEAGSR